MTSGITKGAASIPEKAVRPRKRPRRDIAKAARVPNSVAKVALTKAMRRLSRAASMICSFCQSA